MRRMQTPSQTIGPFFAYALTPSQYGYPMSSLASSDMLSDAVEGEAIRIEGRVFDGDGALVNDAMIEIAHADEQGRYPGATPGYNARFTGFGRCGTGTDAQCRFWFNTLKPGPVAPGDAPHVDVIVFMRGLLSHAFTRMYFADEAEANAADAVLNSVPEPRRQTLIADRLAGTAPVYRFDIHMQGDRETVFFDV